MNLDNLDLEQFTIIPKGCKTQELVRRKKDPRTLPYLYPNTINLTSYAKKAQEFYYYQCLEVVEDLMKRQGFILLPYECIHWNRAKVFGPDRKVKIGRKSFFLMRVNELTKSEKKKLGMYLENINRAG